MDTIHICEYCENKISHKYYELDGEIYCEDCIDEAISDLIHKINKISPEMADFIRDSDNEFKNKYLSWGLV